MTTMSASGVFEMFTLGNLPVGRAGHCAGSALAHVAHSTHSGAFWRDIYGDALPMTSFCSVG